jgi:uncharacterized protein (DUF305 family)
MRTHLSPLIRTLSLAALFGAAACAGARGPKYVGGLEGARAKAKVDSARWPWTAGDVEFMSTMIAHHAQAIEMAKMAPLNGASRSVQILSQRVINAQQDEIGMMNRWLEDRNQPTVVPNPKGHTMVMNGATHTMLMPGMLTEEKMKELEAARGERFDYLFLSYMIEHHRGAITMVKELFSKRGAGQDETVFKFASDVETDQTTEVNRMLQMLLGFTPPEENHR